MWFAATPHSEHYTVSCTVPRLMTPTFLRGVSVAWMSAKAHGTNLGMAWRSGPGIILHTLPRGMFPLTPVDSVFDEGPGDHGQVVHTDHLRPRPVCT